MSQKSIRCLCCCFYLSIHFYAWLPTCTELKVWIRMSRCAAIAENKHFYALLIKSIFLSKGCECALNPKSHPCLHLAHPGHIPPSPSTLELSCNSSYLLPPACRIKCTQRGLCYCDSQFPPFPAMKCEASVCTEEHDDLLSPYCVCYNCTKSHKMSMRS